MRKILFCILMLLLCINLLPASASLKTTFLLNDNEIVFSNYKIKQDVHLVPLSEVASILNAKISYDTNSKIYSVNKGTNSLKILEDSQTCIVNNKVMTLPIAPFIEDTIYVPLSFVIKNLGDSISFNNANNSYIIKSNDIIYIQDMSTDSGNTILLSNKDTHILLTNTFTDESNYIVDALKFNNVEEIDLLIVTKSCKDDYTSLKHLVNDIEIDKVVLMDKELEEKLKEYTTSINKDTLVKTIDKKLNYSVNNNEFILINDDNCNSIFLQGTFSSGVSFLAANYNCFSSNIIFTEPFASLSKIESNDIVHKILSHNRLNIFVNQCNDSSSVLIDQLRESSISFNHSIIKFNPNNYLPSPKGNASDNISGLKIVNIDKKEEVVEIKNISSSKINLNGWELISELGDQRFIFSDISIEPNQSIYIVSGKKASKINENYYIWTKSYIWNNDEADIGYLYDSKGLLISKY